MGIDVLQQQLHEWNISKCKSVMHIFPTPKLIRIPSANIRCSAPLPKPALHIFSIAVLPSSATTCPNSRGA
jgi:hypothetical protein